MKVFIAAINDLQLVLGAYSGKEAGPALSLFPLSVSRLVWHRKDKAMSEQIMGHVHTTLIHF